MTYFVEGLSGHSGPKMKVRRIGEYKTLKKAIAKAQQVIDAYIGVTYKSYMKPRGLFARYRDHGEHPYIFSDGDRNTFNVQGFSHLYYASIRCQEICSGKK
jgi:hypothetical protein